MVIINIDTAKDSKEEIRQTIKYLQSLIEEQEGTVSSSSLLEAETPGFLNPFAEPTPGERREEHSSTDVGSGSSGGMFGMFDSPSATSLESGSESNEEQLDAASLLKESEEYVEMQASDDGEIEVVDEQADTFIEIVEYE